MYNWEFAAAPDCSYDLHSLTVRLTSYVATAMFDKLRLIFGGHRFPPTTLKTGHKNISSYSWLAFLVYLSPGSYFRVLLPAKLSGILKKQKLKKKKKVKKKMLKKKS